MSAQEVTSVLCKHEAFIKATFDSSRKILELEIATHGESIVTVQSHIVFHGATKSDLLKLSEMFLHLSKDL